MPFYGGTSPKLALLVSLFQLLIPPGVKDHVVQLWTVLRTIEE